MGLLCSRIGCSSKAAASLQFNAAQSTAILVDLTPSFGGMPLCENHAASRTAPVGWNIVDRRTGAGNLAVWATEDEPSAKTAPPAKRPPSRRRPDPVPAPTSDPGPEPAVADAAEPAAAAKPSQEPATANDEEPVDFPWHRKYTEDDDEDLMADSPLLSRAFRAAKQ